MNQSTTLSSIPHSTDLGAPASSDGGPSTWQIGLLVVIALATLYVAPVAIVALSLAIGRAFPNSKPSVLRYWPIVAVALTLALINAQKWPVSDLREYYAFLDYLARHSPGAVVGNLQPFTSIRPEEVLFVVYSWLIANCTSGSRVAFTFISTLVIYLSCAEGCRKAIAAISVREHASLSNAIVVAAIAIALLSGMTFALTAHLVRQYLAGAVFFTGMLMYKPRHRNWPLCVAMLAPLVHSSAAFLILPLGIAVIWTRLRVFTWIALGALGTSALLFPLGEKIPAIQIANYLRADSEIPPLLIVMDFALIVTAFLLRTRSTPNGASHWSTVNLLLAFAASFEIVLAHFRSTPFIFFRLYFYFEFCRTPLLAFVLASTLRSLRRLAIPVAAALLLLAVSIVCWRTHSSEWSYAYNSKQPLATLILASALDRIAAIETTPL